MEPKCFEHKQEEWVLISKMKSRDCGHLNADRISKLAFDRLHHYQNETPVATLFDSSLYSKLVLITFV